ncbi:MAG: isocitrate lyase/PEP mutase family protein [Chloroflexi bacterium]|nr:isocitrate lyase/PEP mutase family protein [Chloroflexota bacterium]
MTKNRIHPLIEKGEIFFTAGVYDTLSAKLAERAGFKAVVVSGYAVAASLIGEPDIGLLTQTEILDVSRQIINAVNIPVIVDGDTGYGGALNVIRMVKELTGMGASGVIFEDQTWPKRCGHMRGKSVVEAEEHLQKVKSAVEARGNKHIMIIARTDSLATHGVEEAIRRGNLYKEAGADLIFVDAPNSKEELRHIASGIKAPLVVNMIEGGRTPLLPLEELKELGFVSVGYPLTGIYSAARAIAEAFAHLLKEGNSLAILDKMMQFDEFSSVVGLEEKYGLDEKYGV